MRVKTITILLLASLFLAVSVQAACQWEWLCDEYGECIQAPACDDAYDIPPPEPFDVPPIAPPSVAPPMADTVIPPIGTSECVEVQRQDAWGNWYWDVVCR